MFGFVATYHRPGFALQAPCDAAVVIPSTLRPTLPAALRSVFAQDFAGRIHVLVGIDCPAGDAPMEIGPVEAACAAIPSNVAVQLFYPGYSTARRHGGLVAAGDGGALRTALTHLANSDRVAYLDDDNAWRPDHLATLLAALARADADWAWSLRWFTDPGSGAPLAIDRWESVGPGAGVFAGQFGGFVDPNSLLLDRTRCADAIVAWTTPLPGHPLTADRSVFARLLARRGVGTGVASTLYRMNAADGRHAWRLHQMGLAG